MKKIGRKVSIIVVMFLCFQAFWIVTPPPAYAFPIFGSILQGIEAAACGIAQAVGNIVCGAVQIAGCALRGAAEVAVNVVCGAVQIAGCAIRGAAEVAANVVCGATQAAGCVIRGVAEVVGNVVCGAAQVAGCVARGAAEVACGVAQGIGNAVNCAGGGIQAVLKWKAETCPFRQAYMAGTSSGLAYEIGKWVDNEYKAMGGTNNEVQQSDCALCNIVAGAMGVQPVSGGSAPPTPAPAEPVVSNSGSGIAVNNSSSGIKVYSMPGCPACKDLKDFLTEQGIPFEDIDVSVNQAAAQRIIEMTGQTGVPVLEINGTFVVGFDRSKADELLALIPDELKGNKNSDIASAWVTDEATEVTIKDILEALGIDLEAVAALLQEKGISATLKELSAASGIGEKPFDTLLAELPVECPWIDGITTALGPALMSLTIDNILAVTGTADLSLRALVKNIVLVLEIDSETLTGLLQTKGTSATLKELAAAAGISNETPDSLLAKINVSHPFVNGIAGILGPAVMSSTIDNLLASTGTAEVSISALLAPLEIDDTGINAYLADFDIAELAALDREETPQPLAEEDPSVAIKLTNEDFGKTVKATKDDVIRVTLWGNYYEREQPGYQWDIVYFSKDILQLEKVQPGRASIDKIDNTGGAKTFTTFYFKAVNRGNAMFIAGYHNADKYAGAFFANVDVEE